MPSSANELALAALGDLSAEEAHAALTAVHGIGPWTADIYLLSCLGHADAWPAGDLALQEAARVAFGLAGKTDRQGDAGAGGAVAAVAGDRGENPVDVLSRGRRSKGKIVRRKAVAAARRRPARYFTTKTPLVSWWKSSKNS